MVTYYKNPLIRTLGWPPARNQEHQAGPQAFPYVMHAYAVCNAEADPALKLRTTRLDSRRWVLLICKPLCNHKAWTRVVENVEYSST